MGYDVKLKDLIIKEAEETEISKKVDDLVKKMESLTDKNQHNEALAELAKFFGNKKMEKVMKAIGDIHDELKTMPYGLTQFRNEVMKDLFALAKQRLNGKEYEAVYRSL
jgi:TnpA family transposase